MNVSRTISVVAADDQPIYIAGIRHLLTALSGIVVAGEAGTCSDALTLVQRARPDVLLLSAALPGALALVAQLREHSRSTRVMLLADRIDQATVERALQLGVTGFLLKQIGGFDLAQAVRSAASGLTTMAPEVAAAAHAAQQTDAVVDGLSEREQAVLQLLVRGLSNDDIAEQLCVSRSTVKFHLSNIYDKFGVRTRGAAIAIAYRELPDKQPVRIRRVPEPHRLISLAVGS